MPAVVGLDADRLGRSHLPERRPKAARPVVLWASIATPARVRWKRLLGGGNAPDAQAEHVVAVAGHRRPHVWVMTGTGILQGLRLRRQGALGARHPEGLRALRHHWGYGSSPLLFEDSLYVQVLHGMTTDDPSYVLRIDKANGKTIWRVERPTTRAVRVARCLHDAGAAAHTGGTGDRRSPAATSSPATIRRPAASCGAPTASIPTTTAATASSPRRSCTAICSSRRRASGRCWRSRPAAGATSANRTCSGVQQRPRRADAGHRRHVPLLDQRSRHHVRASTPRRAARVYGRQRLRPATYSGSPVLADGKIYITDEDGVTSVVQAGPTFRDAGRERLRRVHAQLAGDLRRADLHPHRDVPLRDRHERRSEVSEPDHWLRRSRRHGGDARCRASAVGRRSERPGAGGRPHDCGRRRSGPLLAALARAVRAGTGRRHGLPGYLVGHPERAVEDAGAGQRQLVADRLARSDLSDDRPATTADACRSSRIGAPTAPALGDRSRRRASATRRTTRTATRRRRRRPTASASTCRSAAAGCSPFDIERQGRLAAGISAGSTTTTARPARRCSTRIGVILYQDQSSGSFIAAFDTRTGKQLWRTPRQRVGRLGHADRHSRRRSRRDDRQRPEPGDGLQPRHRHASCGGAAAARSK